MTEDLSTDFKVIVFQLLDKEYGIPVSQVLYIEKIDHITRVPGAVPFVKGVINLRGVIIPIIDLRLRFDLEEADYSESTRAIIVSINDMEVGLIVDSANDVIDISPSCIEPPPEVVGSVEVAYIKGVAKLDKRLLILIDLEKVLNISDLQEVVG